MENLLANAPESDDPLAVRRPALEDPHFDITAMVDLVFMMNIFFLVTWVQAALAEIDLPTARHCVAADIEKSVTVTLLAGPDRQTPVIYLGEARKTARPIELSEVETVVRAAVEKGLAEKEPKNILLIKAEKQVQIQHTARVASAAQGVEGVKVNLAVVEKE